MKIALVIDDSLDRSDGVQQYVKTLGAYYANHGHQVDYITTKSVDTQLENVYSLSSSIRLRFNGNNVAVPLPINIRKMRALLKSRHYDIVHIQLPYSPLFSGVLLHYLPPTTAVVGTFHILPYGRIASIGTRMLGVVSTLSLKKFDAVYSVSKPAQQFADNVYGIKSKVVANAVDVASFKSSVKTDPGTVLFLGRLVERKGCADFLKIMSEVRKLYTGHLQIHIAGDGPERKSLEAMCRQLGLHTHTTFHGYVEDQDKKTLYASSQIAVFPSLGGESFGMVLVEAMAHGNTVVIAGNNSGYSSVMKGRKQQLINPKNHSEAAKTIIRYLESSTERKHAIKWQNSIKTEYDVNTVGHTLLQAYSDILQSKITLSYL